MSLQGSVAAVVTFNANSFTKLAVLQDPSVVVASLEKRIAFLKSKNLTKEEIDISLARANESDAGNANGSVENDGGAKAGSGGGGGAAMQNMQSGYDSRFAPGYGYGYGPGYGGYGPGGGGGGYFHPGTPPAPPE